MKIVAALFILIILSLGLLNSYRKYKKELLPLNFLFAHVLLGLLLLGFCLYLLFE